MLRTVLEMVVREGCEDAFRAAWLETAQAASRLPGCVAQSLLRDPRNPRTHLVMADWADRAALEGFQNGPARSGSAPGWSRSVNPPASRCSTSSSTCRAPHR